MISRHVAEIEMFFSTTRDQQKTYQKQKLAEIIDFANSEVPYKDIYAQHKVTEKKF